MDSGSGCAAALALDFCRAILTRAKNATTSANGSMENRNYTVELWRPSKFMQPVGLLASRFGELHFNQDGIKRGRVAHIGKFFRGKDIDVASLFR
jgi:hypothetical protein